MVGTRVAPQCFTLHRPRQPTPHAQDCCTLAVVLWGEAPTAVAERAHGQLVAMSFDQLMERGRQAVEAGWQRAAPQRDDLASLAFTSGTSGRPKVRDRARALGSCLP